jgi:hypothetical protein
MRTKRFTLLAAALFSISPSGFAQELRPGVPSVLYYVSIPLDGVTRKDKDPVVGFALQGARAYQAVRFDSRMMNFLEAGFEAKWLLVGAVAAGGAVAISSKDKSVSQQQQQQQQAQQQQQVQKQQSQQNGTPCVC